MGDMKNSLDHLKILIKIISEVAGESHPSLLVYYMPLGNLYSKLEMYKEAIESFDKALQIGIVNYGEKNNSVQACYNEIFTTCDLAIHHYMKKDDIDEVTNYVVKSMNLMKQVYGDDKALLYKKYGAL